MVTILNDPFKVEFQTATLWMIFITSFVCGGTIKAIVNILGIEKHDTGTQKKICENVNEKCIDHVMAGVETVVGRKVSNYRVLNWIIQFEDKFVKKLLVNKDAEHTFLRTLEKLSLDEHYARLYGKASKPNAMMSSSDSLTSLETTNLRMFLMKLSLFIYSYVL